MTCLLIASKYDELDENIPLIRDLQRYYTRVLPTSVVIPSFDEIIESERELMEYFHWDLMVVNPTQVLKLMLANGVIFDNENIPQEKLPELASLISDKSLQILETLVKEMHQFRD
jgi:hypothetical protein